MDAPLLQVEGLGKRFGGFVALDGIDLSVAQGERVGLIGPNGSGKSTLVNCLCGTLANETGTVRFEGRGLGSQLVRSALADARRDGLAVLPFCPFVRSYIASHTEELDLVPENMRATFDLPTHG